MKNLFVIDGASGTGKSDLLHYVENFKSKVSLVRKYTTRSQRDYEKEKGWGLDLRFVSPNGFDRLNLDYQYKYGGYSYGFHHAELDACLARHSNVFVIVRSAEVIGQLVEDYGFINVVPVYIYTDQEKIRERLYRQKVSEEQVQFRLGRIREAFEDYLRHPQIYCEVVINNSTIEDYHRLIDMLINKYKTAPEVNEKLVFVLMSFNPDNPKLKDRYRAMQRAVNEYDPSMTCVNLDEITGSFKISDMAKKNVRNCRLAIVDLTENKPNVYYELGYVHGIAKECIITAPVSTEKLFYPREYRILEYDSDWELQEKLVEQLKGVLGSRVPVVNGVSSKKKPVPMHGSEPIKILFLAANPSDTTRLKVDKEIREIRDTLRRSEFRDKFRVEQEWAVRDTDLQGYLLQHEPDIVHFSGHGSESSEIILEDDSGSSHPVSVRALSQVFSLLKDNIRCVILNACYSESQAQAIAEHVDCVIGMSRAIGDSAAIRFSKAFYQALGYGKDVKTAFDSGCAEIDLGNMEEQDTPKLLAARDRPEHISFLDNSQSNGV